MSVLVAGTIAIDDIKTPTVSHKNLLGGSACYAAISSSYFAPTVLQGIVGQDFPKEHVETLKKHGIDLGGVEFSDGKTFYWSGEYFDDLNTRETLDVQLNVIEDYHPKLAENVASSKIVLLANMSPVTQMEVLEQCKADFIIADTMDLWINVTLEPLKALLKKINLLVLNDSEAKQLAETNNLITAGNRLREMGPDYVVVKKGEHGSLLFAKDHFFTCGAFPLHEVLDPTGAGDTFAGALAGHLAKSEGPIEFKDLCQGVVHGTVMASFVCEEFSTRRLHEISPETIQARYDEFIRYTSVI
ncbi:MAG: sugar/nucleoside kinase (ribokinase family) [Verrucomicrobiales bacterium]|jgi:sugar/nucleoside kinase (ribokinase family)